MATYNSSFIVNLEDLTRILWNIRIAERHAAGENLLDVINQVAGPGNAASLVPFGLRTVDGSFNHLLPGETLDGAADQLFPRLLDPSYRTTTTPTTTFEIGGPPRTVGNNNYDPTNPEIGANSGTSQFSVVDAAPRLISNLIVDQTFENTAAVVSALMTAGSANPLADADALIAARAAALAEAAPSYLNFDLSLTDAIKVKVDEVLSKLTSLASGLLADGLFDGTDGADAAAAQTAANDAITAATDLLTSLTNASAPAGEIVDATALVNNLTTLATNVSTAITNASDGSVTLLDYNAVTAVLDTAKTLATTVDANKATVAFANMMEQFGVAVSSDGSIAIPNVSPDIGLSPPNSGWMTLFGQFFDHGLDLVTKGGNGTVYIPLSSDDKFYDFGADGIVSSDDGAGADGLFNTTDDSPNVMMLTRATMFDANGNPIPSGTESQNTTTPFVDQNQTYTSVASHQVFLREYTTDGNGNAISTGHLLGNSHGGIGTWLDVKNQARDFLGLTLNNQDVKDVPLLLADPYGKFIPGANGFAQLVVDVLLSNGTHMQTVVEGRAGGLNIHSLVPADISASVIPPGLTVTAVNMVGTGHAFLNDIAHAADPGTNTSPSAADADTTAGSSLDPVPFGVFDDELLDQHFITGDGRGNENIGLTSVHFIFHAEHDRVVEADKITILRSGDINVIKDWLLDHDTGALPAGFPGVDATDTDLKTYADTLTWDGERLFQAARFTTEMQYQHMVFEEFARRVQPNVDPFIFTNSASLDPDIVAEFAHVVYRFGHSMLTDSVDRLQNNLTTVNGDADQVRLIDAFLNPAAFTASGDGLVNATSDIDAASNIIRGMSRQVGNEIDEFVVDSLRNFLVGQPLDLPALNIARGRDTGIPGLNDARAQLYAGTGHADVKPYTSWLDFAQHLKHPISLINFIAAYGTHSSITSATTIDEKRDAALELVFGTDANGDNNVAGDRLDFLNATGAYAGGTLGGLNDVDLWIGGLAEELNEFGGQLGSTFNFIFEFQLEQLQNGDRFYYLSRTQGMNLLNQLEGNTFTDIIMRNTNLGDLHATHLPAEIMEVPDMIIELDPLVAQEDYNGTAAGNDVAWADSFQQAIDPKVVKILGSTDVDNNGFNDGNILTFSGGEHVVLGGTEGNDRLIGDKGIDTLWGDGGDDYLNAGMESDQVFGGDGDDIIEDPFGDDFLRGEAGDDVIVNGAGLDILFGGTGNDFIMAVTDTTEVFAGPGDDFILGGSAPDGLLGNEGDDWIEGGEGFDGLSGENSELFFNSPIVGHDILWGQGNDTDYDGENGDDIMVQGAGIQRNNGMEGFDWGIHKGDTKSDGTATDAFSDMSNLLGAGAVNPAFILRDRFDSVEGLSGWDGNDTLLGASTLIVAGGGFDSKLTQEGVDRIDGLKFVIGSAALQPDSLGGIGADPTLNNAPNTVVLTSQRAHDGGEIILGGGGGDVMMGALGNDIMDGDAWLNVRISVHEDKVPVGVNNQDIAGNPEIFTVNSLTETISGTGNLAFDGHNLADLMRTGVINPGQLKAVREILNSDGTKVSTTLATTDDGTIDINGVFHGDVDIAMFRYARSEYIVETDVNGVTGDGDGDGFIRIEHVPVGRGGGALRDADGIDFIRNFEVLKFADFTEIIQEGLTNNAAEGLLDITETNGAGAFNQVGILEVGDTLTVNALGITDLDGLPDISKFTFTWQYEQTPGLGDWADVTDPVTGDVITGMSFTPTAAFELDGLSLRVAGNFTDLHGIPETVFSAATAPLVGTAPLGPEPPAALGALLPAVDPAGDPVPLGTVGVFEDGGPLLITRDQLLAGVTDIDTPIANLVISNLTIRIRPGDPDPGTLTGPDINGNWTYSPAADFSGGLVFNFDVSDGTNLPVGLEATLEVLPVNDIPVEIADVPLGTTFAGAGATPVNFSLADIFANFSGAVSDGVGGFVDADGDAVTVVAGSVVPANPAQGTINDNGDGTYTFTANAGSNGAITVNFQITDGTGSANDPAVSGAIANSIITLTNVAATGTSSLSDTTPTQNVAISAQTLGITDLNGVGPLNFQWQVSADGNAPWTNVGAASANPNFNPGAATVGRFLRVEVSFVDGGGATETITSASSLRVVGTNQLGTGLANNDSFTGNAGDDIMNGLLGNDTLIGGGGDDSLDGSLGSDLIDGGNGNDTLVDGGGNDIVDGGTGDDTITLDTGILAGQDIIRLSGGFGTDTVNNFDANPTGGQDRIDISALGVSSATFAASVAIAAAAGNTTVTIGGNTVTFNGVNGVGANAISQADFILTTAPTISGSAIATTIAGTNGADIIAGNGGNDIINAGNGDDVVIWNAPGDGRDFVDGGANGVGGDFFIVNGDNTSETFRVYTRAEALIGGMTGINAATEIVITRNGTANASIIAELDNIEEIRFNGFDAATTGGTAGGDTYQIIGNFAGTSLRTNTIEIDGGTGNDTVDISQLTSDHRVVFNTGGGTDTFVGAVRPQDIVDTTETAEPTSLRFVGTNGNNYMGSAAGNNSYFGLGGKDWFVAGDGNDTYYGGTDVDSYTAWTQTTGVYVSLLKGKATGSGIGVDVLKSVENVFGGSAGDIIGGSTGRNVLKGNDGNDRIDGRQGHDVIDGGSGNDRLRGGQGNDHLTGGDGHDYFIFNRGFGNDVIRDFDANPSRGQDKLDLTELKIAVADFKSQVHILDAGADVIVDIDGVGTIRLKDVAHVNDVTIHDFVLFGG